MAHSGCHCTNRGLNLAVSIRKTPLESLGITITEFRGCTHSYYINGYPKYWCNTNSPGKTLLHCHSCHGQYLEYFTGVLLWLLQILPHQCCIHFRYPTPVPEEHLSHGWVSAQTSPICLCRRSILPVRRLHVQRPAFSALYMQCSSHVFQASLENVSCSAPSA